MQTILFQGDSVTDAGRSRDNDMVLGHGYPVFAAGKLGLDHPDRFKFYNRGVSGNRIVDVYARIKKDIINLKPDYMSILIGINDVWHEVDWQNGVDADKYFRIYDMLITEVKEALPDIKIIILEPFVLPGTATNEHLDYFMTETALRAEKAKLIAEKHGLIFVPLQEKLNGLTKSIPENMILADGVHPTFIGHEFIARELVEAYKPIL